MRFELPKAFHLVLEHQGCRRAHAPRPVGGDGMHRLHSVEARALQNPFLLLLRSTIHSQQRGDTRLPHIRFRNPGEGEDACQNPHSQNFFTVRGWKKSDDGTGPWSTLFCLVPFEPSSSSECFLVIIRCCVRQSTSGPASHKPR